MKTKTSPKQKPQPLTVDEIFGRPERPTSSVYDAALAKIGKAPANPKASPEFTAAFRKLGSAGNRVCLAHRLAVSRRAGRRGL